MNTLSSALSNALSGLMVSSGQSALVARNIARAGEENYVRKYAEVTTNIDGSPRLSAVYRSAEKGLLDSLTTATSSMNGQNVLLESIGKLQLTVGDLEDDQSIASQISDLQGALIAMENDPSSNLLAGRAVRSAASLASAFNDGARTIQNVRAEADAGMKKSVDQINLLLSRLQEVNTTVVKGIAGQVDVVEAMDQRDAILKSLSSEIGIRSVIQSDNGVAVYSESGVTLFNVVSRKIAFAPTPGINAAMSGNSVYADGVAIAGPSTKMTGSNGILSAHAQVRDHVAAIYQAQFDEIARAMVEIFSESDQRAVPTLPRATGLLGYSGSPVIPPSATLVPGLASSIKLNVAFDPDHGGNPFLLRDGGANGIAYKYNNNPLGGYQTRLTDMISSFDTQMVFSASGNLPVNSSVITYAQNSAGWLEGLRSDTKQKNEYLVAVGSRTKDALSRATGVNLDEEMATMLDLEKSYQASAKVLMTIDRMFSTLMEAVR
jgi:flagellar hook-associated protein 1